MYSNTNGFIVILDDDRNADTSWRNHLERGSAGGVDCVAPMRTPLRAPTDCTVSSYWGGTGGRTIRMAEVDGNRRPTGWVDEFMHTDEAPITGFVAAGGFVGYSGRSGGDYDPHVHWHRIDPGGKRRNPWHYFMTAPAAGAVRPINRKEPTVFIARRKGSAYLIVPAESGRLFASVLGGQDAIDGLPSVTFNWDTAWMQFRTRLVNPSNVPN